MQISYLEIILKTLKKKNDSIIISIPGLWIDQKSNHTIEVDFCQFLIEQISEIVKTPPTSKRHVSDWTASAVVYNLFVRLFTAYDHDQDGKIGESKNGLTLNENGVRETGTFIKTIALLPYLKKLGINTIHLLPITEIGKEGRKGDLGSPYAIKNPFKIDPNLADPIVDIPIEDQYKALIEAAHHLGIQVVQEFIFRTGAVDSDWIIEQPDWFYWINNVQKYAAPKFTKEALELISKVPKGKGKYIPPPKSYQALFAIPPDQPKNSNLKVASAFADWPPDDLQPPWSDVTYLRLYNYDFHHKNNYNYIAYNTIRYYDPVLSKDENINISLWNKIAEIIPYYQKAFGIDGAMIDMGHALPNLLKSKIIKNARDIDSGFAFWDENFDNKEETKKDGYNAVIGDVWYRINKRNGFKNLIKNGLASKPLAYFGAAETHNSPRLTNSKKKKSAWLLFHILPGAIPFLHNGYELQEHLPVNTGLNFSRVELERLSQEKLALFYKTSLNWGSKNILQFMTKVANLISEYAWIFDGLNLEVLETSNRKVLGYYKKSGDNKAVILFNTNFYELEQFALQKTSLSDKYFNILTDELIDMSQAISMSMGQVIIGTKLLQPD